MTQPPADTPAPLSGFQFRIHSGEHQATITDVGAKVRSYAVGGRNVFTPFGADQVAPTGHGALLAPWPNRLRDGRYAYAGTEYQVDISEPPTNTALHGLVMWQRWQVVAVGVRGVVDGHHLPALPHHQAVQSGVGGWLADVGLVLRARVGVAPVPQPVGPWGQQCAMARRRHLVGAERGEHVPAADGVAAHLGTDIGDHGLVLTGVDPELEPGERGWGVGRGLGHPGRLAPCLFTRRRSGR